MKRSGVLCGIVIISAAIVMFGWRWIANGLPSVLSRLDRAVEWWGIGKIGERFEMFSTGRQYWIREAASEATVIPMPHDATGVVDWVAIVNATTIAGRVRDGYGSSNAYYFVAIANVEVRTFSTAAELDRYLAEMWGTTIEALVHMTPREVL